MPLDNLRSDITNIQSFDWGNELENIVETNKDELVKLQQDQWWEGKDSLGQPITLYEPISGTRSTEYALSTIEGIPGVFEGKKQKGQPYDRITLKDTGALYSSLKATVEQRTFELKGDTDYEESLIERTGDEVYGLDEDKRQQFGNNVTLPAIKTIFNEKTGYVIS
jgi:hypothetical protein